MIAGTWFTSLVGGFSGLPLASYFLNYNVDEISFKSQGAIESDTRMAYTWNTIFGHELIDKLDGTLRANLVAGDLLKLSSFTWISTAMCCCALALRAGLWSFALGWSIVVWITFFVDLRELLI